MNPLSALFSLFAGQHPMLTLLPISVLAGIGMLWVFRHTSDQQAIKRARNRLSACLYELRLFTDEPSLIFAAQRTLLVENAKLILLVLRPMLVLAIPFTLLAILLDPFYGRTPLPVNRPALVVAQMESGSAPDSAPRLEVPAGIVLETPGVRSLRDRQVTWRVRPVRETEGDLRISVAGANFEKQIDSRPGPRYLSDRRAAEWSEWIWRPVESRLPAGAIRWIDVRYPAADVSWLGVSLHWTLWFLILSTIAALLFKNRMGVSF